MTNCQLLLSSSARSLLLGKLYFAVVATITRQYKPIVLVGSLNHQKYPQFCHNLRELTNARAIKDLHYECYLKILSNLKERSNITSGVNP